MEKHALVLGGHTGLLGQALKRTLLAHQWQVETLGREDGDLLDMVFLEETLARKKPSVIFNTMGWTQVDAAEDDENAAAAWNRGLPSNLARLIKGSSTRLVHYSTDFVFPGNARQNYAEDDETGPMSAYGRTKLAGERSIMETAPDQCCILRTAWLFGPGRKNFITTILEACHKKDQISVIHDQIGSPTYTIDLAHWSMLAAEKGLSGIYHAVNGGRASWCDLACEAVSLAEAPCRVDPIATAQWPQKATRPRFSVLNTAKLAAAIGVTPRPWPQALRDYLFTECLNRDLCAK